MKAATADHPAAVLKPFLWIGAMAFATGFLGYLGLYGIPV